METDNPSAIIIEDNHTDFIILKQMLLEYGIEDHNIAWSACLADFKFARQTFVLCDLNLPDSEGRNTLRAVLDQTRDSGSSVIVMTGLADEQLAQESIQLGAQDYLIKGTFSAGVLRKTLTFSYERNRLFQRLSEKQQELLVMEQYLSTVLSTVPGVIIRFDRDLKLNTSIRHSMVMIVKMVSSENHCWKSHLMKTDPRPKSY